MHSWLQDAQTLFLYSQNYNTICAKLFQSWIKIWPNIVIHDKAMKIYRNKTICYSNLHVVSLTPLEEQNFLNHWLLILGRARGLLSFSQIYSSEYSYDFWGVAKTHSLVNLPRGSVSLSRNWSFFVSVIIRTLLLRSQIDYIFQHQMRSCSLDAILSTWTQGPYLIGPRISSSLNCNLLKVTNLVAKYGLNQNRLRRLKLLILTAYAEKKF